MVLNLDSNVKKEHSDVLETLSLKGWVPVGQHGGDRLMAYNFQRCLFNPLLNLGFYFPSSSVKVNPRMFVSAYDLEDCFAQIVSPRFKGESNVPCLHDLPLVLNWNCVLDDEERKIDLTEMERRRLATIKIMPEELKYIIWKAYTFDSESHPEHMRVYRDAQKKWFDRSSQILNMRNHGNISKPECMEHYFKDGSALEFRIDFALKNPDWMEVERPRVDLRSANIREPYEFAA